MKKVGGTTLPGSRVSHQSERVGVVKPRLLCSPICIFIQSLVFYSSEYFTSLNRQIACIFTPLNIFTSLKNKIGNRTVAAPDYFLLGWGLRWGGKNIKSQNWLIFAIFVLVRGVCGGRASDRGRAKCPMAPPMSPLTFLFPQRNAKHYKIWA